MGVAASMDAPISHPARSAARARSAQAPLLSNKPERGEGGQPRKPRRRIRKQSQLTTAGTDDDVAAIPCRLDERDHLDWDPFATGPLRRLCSLFCPCRLN